MQAIIRCIGDQADAGIVDRRGVNRAASDDLCLMGVRQEAGIQRHGTIGRRQRIILGGGDTGKGCNSEAGSKDGFDGHIFPLVKLDRNMITG